MEGSFERVTREKPCVICGRNSWCIRLNRYHLCMRIESEKPGENGGWYHTKDAKAMLLPLPPRKRRVSDEELRDRFTPTAEQSAKNGIDKLAELSVKLSVSINALVKLGVGYSENLHGVACWTFPERNSRGWIIGIARRLVAPRNGVDKLFCKGSRRGLTYCEDWASYHGPVYLVEGASDVAAGLTMGLCVIGRPACTGGIAHLAEMLAGYRKRRIVVVGERDRKSDLYIQQSKNHDPKCTACQVCWPGRYGMERTAKALRHKLNRKIAMGLPPEPAKDLRSWFVASGVEPRQIKQCVMLNSEWKRLVG